MWLEREKPTWLTHVRDTVEAFPRDDAQGYVSARKRFYHLLYYALCSLIRLLSFTFVRMNQLFGLFHVGHAHISVKRLTVN